MMYLMQRGFPALVLLGALLLRIHDPVFLSDVRLRIFDTFQRIHPREYVDPAGTPVGLIGVSRETTATPSDTVA